MLHLNDVGRKLWAFACWTIALMAPLYLTSSVHATGLPPFSETFSEAYLPTNNVCWSFSSSGDGRIMITGDDTVADSNEIPDLVVNQQSTGASRMRGNVFLCTNKSVLTKSEFFLTRTNTVQVTLVVYESSTSNGTYTLIASNTVSAGVGSNFVSSGSIDVGLQEGKFYFIGAAWDEAAQYFWRSGGHHPQNVGMGRSLNGVQTAFYPPLTSFINQGATNNNLAYHQRITTSTNCVMRMDDAVSGVSTSANRGILTLFLQDLPEAVLTFRHRESSDETNALLAGDGIFLSTNGVTQVKIVDIQEPDGNWHSYEIDLISAAASNGMTLGPQTRIVFQQVDDFPWPSDGREFDDICVSTLPDIDNFAVAPDAIGLTFRGFTDPKLISITNHFIKRAGSNDIGFANYGLRMELFAPELAHVQTNTYFTSFSAYTITTSFVHRTMTVPGATKLSNYLYVVRTTVDPENALAEAQEDNNTNAVLISLNHYSGNLFFDDVKTIITITNWAGVNATNHTISGTGTVAGFGFSYTNLTVIKDLATLDYRVDLSDSTILFVNATNENSVQDVDFVTYNGVYLAATGAYGNVRACFPAGLGYTSNTISKVLEKTIAFTNVSFNSLLLPNSDPLNDGSWQFVEETKPIYTEVSKVQWFPQEGRFELNPIDVTYVRGQDLDDLETAFSFGFITAEMAKKRSNEQYYRFLSVGSGAVQARSDDNGAAEMDMVTGIATGKFYTHFPYDVSIQWTGTTSSITITGDLVDASASYLDYPKPFDVSYLQSCPGCAGGDKFTNVVVTSDVNRLYLTVDGGFQAAGSLQMAHPVAWGYISSIPDFAQETDPFSLANFYASGHFMRGDQDTFYGGEINGPGIILMTGVLSNDLTMTERPGSAGYVTGLADYPGVNFRVNVDSAKQANSTIGGTNTGNYDLTGRSKYYVRRSGVSGIHEALFGGFPTNMTIYGYDFTFSNYGLNYLSSTNRDSRTEGDVTLIYPSDFVQEFEELTFTCLGDLDRAEFPDGMGEKTLVYWDAPFTPLSLSFESASDCTVGDSYLTMHIKSYADHIDEALYGYMGWYSDGNLIAKSGADALGLEDVDSKLSIPSFFNIDGPGSEEYYFMPVNLACFNDYAQAGSFTSSTLGFVSMPGTIDVPFFEDLQAHVHTGAGTNNDSQIYIMGGWPDEGWTAGGEDFFSHSCFDSSNIAYPPAANSITNYRSQSDSDYIVRARRTWLGIVDFNYPLTWNASTKAFTSFAPVENNLLILAVEHQVDYLSAENAEISFGIQYGDLPTINIANMVVNAVDEATGVASAFTDAVTDTLVDTLTTGLDELDKMLQDQADALFDEIFDKTLDPTVCGLYNALSNSYVQGVDYYSTEIDKWIRGVGAGSPVSNVQAVLSNIDDGFGTTSGLVQQVSEGLERVDRVIQAITTDVTIDPNTGLPLGSAVTGLLHETSGEYPILSSVASELLNEIASEIVSAIGGSLEDQINDTMDKVAPSLEALRETLGQVQLVVDNVHTQLDATGAFAQEVSDAIDSAIVSNVTAAIAGEVKHLFEEFDDQFSPFDEYTPEEIKDRIRTRIENEFYSSTVVADVKTVMRSWIYDLDNALREATDSVFQQVNGVMRDLMSDYLAELDDSISGMLDDLSSVIGSGQIDGYAHIKGDSLSRLRLDGQFQWKVPDELEFGAFLLIEELNADGTGGCGFDGGDGNTVTLGATDVPCSWIGSDVAINVSTKFTFFEGSLVGMAGAFEIASGEISFEAFVIGDFGAAVAFGALENYLAANMRASFSSYEVAGGLFFGRTCTIDPIELIDPDVASVLGEPPFTGAYVYGEAWMAIVDYGCLFNISAGVGAGAFYFVEGPTYGMKMLLGAKGEALCVVSIKGEVTLVGVKSGDSLSATGKGKLKGKAGACPFCVKFSKTVKVTYKDGSWSADY